MTTCQSQWITSWKIGCCLVSHEETGKHRKLSRPWHGPYRIIQRNDPDVTTVKVFFPEEGSIQVHKTQVCPCPGLPAGFYWYEGNRKSPGGVPRWLQQLSSTPPDTGLQQPPSSDPQAGGSERDELPVEDSDSKTVEMNSPICQSNLRVNSAHHPP